MFQGFFMGTHATDLTRETYTYKTLTSPASKDECNERARTWSTNLKLDLFRPIKTINNKPAPIIFHIHGGSWKYGDKTESTTWSFDYFLKRGYAVVSVQYSLVCYGYNALDMLGDLRAAHTYVASNATKWGLDPENFHYVGESAGAHLAMLTAYTSNFTSVRSVLNNYGPSNFQRWPFSCSESDFMMKWLYKLAGDCSAASLAAISPALQITANSPPTITMHGTFDSLVAYQSQAKDLHDALDQAGVPNLLVTMSSYGHYFDGFSYYGIPVQIQRYVFERLLAATGV